MSAYPGSFALLAGVLAATGFQPLALWPVALLAMGGFALLVGRASGWRQAARLGWLFGVGHFTLGNNWIATAFTYQAEMPALLGWVAVPLLALYLAIYPALAAGAAKALIDALGRKTGAPRTGEMPRWTIAPALGGFWITAEWLRGWVLSGYAWNPFGVALLGPFDRPGLAAIAPWTGTYALSGLAVMISAGLALALAGRRFAGAAFAALLLAAAMVWPAPAPREGTLAVTIVQPNLHQDRLNEPLLFEANYQRLARNSRTRAPGRTRLVLWPESGLVDYLREGYPQRYYDQTTALGSPAFARMRIGRAIGPGSLLLTGAVDLEIEQGRAAGAYNAVTALDADGAIVGGYAKAHLVPFGEFLPWRSVLEPLGLSRLVAGTIDFIPGPGPQTLDLGRFGQAGVQVCYEIVFSGRVVDRAHRPDYIFNPSNDGWFGRFGPPQHLAQARLRAMEEGLPVLRATTTGISAVIDGHGIVRAFLPSGRMGRIDTVIPPALAPTLFSRMGNGLGLIWSAVLLCSTAIAIRRRRR